MSRLLARIETLVLALTLALAAGLTLLTIVGRNFLGVGFGGLEELSVYLLIWMVFTGMAQADRLGAHIAIDVAPHLLGPGASRVLARLVDGLQGALALVLAWVAFDATMFSWMLGETSVQTLQAPIWIVMAVMAPAFLVVGARSLARAFSASSPRHRQTEGV